MKFIIFPNKSGFTFSAVPGVATSIAGRAFIVECDDTDAARSAAVQLYQAQQAKLAALAKAQPKTVTVGGIAIGIDDATMTWIHRLATGIRMMIDAGAPTTTLLSAGGMTITDAAGSTHDMTLAQANALILAYIQAYGAIRAQSQAASAAVAAATTVAAVQAVAVPQTASTPQSPVITLPTQ